MCVFTLHTLHTTLYLKNCIKYFLRNDKRKGYITKRPTRQGESCTRESKLRKEMRQKWKTDGWTAREFWTGSFPANHVLNFPHPRYTLCAVIFSESGRRDRSAPFTWVLFTETLHYTLWQTINVKKWFLYIYKLFK